MSAPTAWASWRLEDLAAPVVAEIERIERAVRAADLEGVGVLLVRDAHGRLEEAYVCDDVPVGALHDSSLLRRWFWVSDLIACPRCRARLDQLCEHPERLVSRRCHCGETLRQGRSYCSEPCRVRARRRTWRDSKRRHRPRAAA